MRTASLLFVTTLCAGLVHAEPGSLSPHAATELSGGDATVFDTSRNAFGRTLGNLSRFRWQPMREGKALFLGRWSALGPLYNADSCASCHFKDGRGDVSRSEPGLLLRLSAPSAYGGQVNDHAVPGAIPEGRVEVSWRSVEGRYPDGRSYELLEPSHRLAEPAYGPLPEGAVLSARTPPPLLGMGLLEAVPDAVILELADPDDADGDGISGRPSWVGDPAADRPLLGRFGWKAEQPSLERQIATALAEDIGVDHTEISPHQLSRLVLYTRLLGVPARRDVTNPEVHHGESLFSRVGCSSCHYPSFETGAVADVPELGFQAIRPYTDLLLHDMGDGLADSSREWRTAPLWGLGLTEAVTGFVRLLHDGRARGVEEAILWHGGEAAASREEFMNLPLVDRQAVLRFLESL